MIDKVALGVEFSWEKEGQPTTSVIFERNSPLPSVKLLTFYRCDVNTPQRGEGSAARCTVTTCACVPADAGMIASNAKY